MITMFLTVFMTSVIVGLCVLFVRVVYLLFVIYTKECKFESDNVSLRTLICIGSGGHTAEMLRLLNSLDLQKFHPRLYVTADTDVTSEVKINQQEKERCSTGFEVRKIPRSRHVNQSFHTAVLSTLSAVVSTIPVIFNFKPEVILCNGPGTCVPICIVVFIMRCLFLLDCRIVFVESICRVRTLSLTGKILQYFADIVIVQWPLLRDMCFRAKFFGRLT